MSGRSRLLIAVSAAIWAYAIGRWLDSRGIYLDWEVWFAGDPNWYLPRLEDGSFESRRHPLLHVFAGAFRLPVSALSLALGVEMTDLWRGAIVALPALVAGLKALLLVDLLVRLGLSRMTVILLVVLDQTSTSHLTFGTVPESYGATALAAIWALALLVKTTPEQPRSWEWFACGVFSFGVTVTNLAFFGVSWMASRLHLGWPVRRLVRSGIVLVTLIVGTTVLAFLAVHPFVRPPSGAGVGVSAPAANAAAVAPASTARPGTPGIAGLQRWFSAPVTPLLHTPIGITQAFIADPPRITASGFRAPRSPVYFGRPEGWGPTTLTWVVLVLGSLAIGAGRLWRQGPLHRTVAVVATVGVGANMLLFSVWGGDNRFMYGLHWQPWALLLLSGVAHTARASGPWAVSALLAAQVAINAAFVRAVIGALR